MSYRQQKKFWYVIISLQFWGKKIHVYVRIKLQKAGWNIRIDNNDDYLIKSDEDTGWWFVKTEAIFFGTRKPVLVFWHTDTSRFRKNIVVTLDYVMCMSACVRIFCKRKSATLNQLLTLKKYFQTTKTSQWFKSTFILKCTVLPFLKPIKLLALQKSEILD
jgi:hypothetical protein